MTPKPLLRLTKDGVISLRFSNNKKGAYWRAMRAIATAWNTVARAVIRRTAPLGLDTSKELWEVFEHSDNARELSTDRLPLIWKAMSATDFSEVAKDLADMADLHACVDYLVIQA